MWTLAVKRTLSISSARKGIFVRPPARVVQLCRPLTQTTLSQEKEKEKERVRSEIFPGYEGTHLREEKDQEGVTNHSVTDENAPLWHPSKFHFMSESQFIAETERCLQCEEKPCLHACPSRCSPMDFILRARSLRDVDIQRAAVEIRRQNPFGGTCGVVCPDKFCMGGCVRKDIDTPVDIPALQAFILARAAEHDARPEWKKEVVEEKREDAGEGEKKRVCVVGAGPSGLSAAAYLSRKGYDVEVLERSNKAGGSTRTIPKSRLPHEMIDEDVKFIEGLGNIQIKYGYEVSDPTSLLSSYDAVCVATGRYKQIPLDIPGGTLAIPALEYLTNPDKYDLGSKDVAIIGGGPVAMDCATTAAEKGKDVFLFYRRRLSDMPLTEKEKARLFIHRINFIGNSVPIEILESHMHPHTVSTLLTARTSLPPRRSDVTSKSSKVSFQPLSPLPIQRWDNISAVIVAIGTENDHLIKESRGLFYAGDMAMGSSTVVEAAAHGKQTAAIIHAYLSDPRADIRYKAGWEIQKGKEVERKTLKGKWGVWDKVEGYDEIPVPLKSSFFGIHEMENPFLLSAAPLTDGYENMKRAYDAGWAGGVMKTAFNGVHIHIPSQYMTKFGKETFGNCDNVSEHSLSRVCDELKRLREEYPHKLTMGSTGGPLTGDHDRDKERWQQNTLLLERAGAVGVEYSLSCPQGGDESHGAIASQSEEVTSRIVDWVMEISDPKIPKLFKLTAAVSSMPAIIKAVKRVLQKYPHKLAGVTLANSFPTLTFKPDPLTLNRDSPPSKWEKGVVVGMSGAGVVPISYLALASVANLGVEISGNGGPMDYMEAVNFLALGCKTVQFCTLPTKKGLGIINELTSGLSHTLQARKMKSVSELIGVALPNPIQSFEDLPPEKQKPHCVTSLCVHCGNCQRCPYGAIHLDKKTRLPVVNEEVCIGCSMCALNCPTNALWMGERDVAKE